MEAIAVFNTKNTDESQDHCTQLKKPASSLLGGNNKQGKEPKKPKIGRRKGTPEVKEETTNRRESGNKVVGKSSANPTNRRIQLRKTFEKSE